MIDHKQPGKETGGVQWQRPMAVSKPNSGVGMNQRCQVTEDLNRHLAQEEKDSEYAEAISEIVTELTAKGCDYYPWQAAHVMEAVTEMSADKWVTLTGVLRDCLPTSSGLREVVEAYWLAAAETAAVPLLEARIERAREDAAADASSSKEFERWTA